MLVRDRLILIAYASMSLPASLRGRLDHVAGYWGWSISSTLAFSDTLRR